jgi:hypothetical protein
VEDIPPENLQNLSIRFTNPDTVKETYFEGDMPSQALRPLHICAQATLEYVIRLTGRILSETEG